MLLHRVFVKFPGFWSITISPSGRAPRASRKPIHTHPNKSLKLCVLAPVTTERDEKKELQQNADKPWTAVDI